MGAHGALARTIARRQSQLRAVRGSGAAGVGCANFVAITAQGVQNDSSRLTPRAAQEGWPFDRP